MIIPIVDPAGMQIALQSRLEQNARLGDRTKYIGASEIGSCLRRVVLSKLNPEPFDQASMGRMLAGKAMENEVVQLVRIALNGRLRNTGRAQLEFKHPTIPLVAHPDGTVLAGIAGLDGDGVLEVKTAGAATFKRYQNNGLPTQYLDQVQAQMGLSPGLTWALVVLVSRENLAEMTTFTVRFDPEHYAQLEGRAARAMDILTYNIRNELPGEPERGFCHTCPYAVNCGVFLDLRKAGESGEVAEVVRLQLECQMEELNTLERELEPIQERTTALRELIKTTLSGYLINRVVLDGGVLQMVTSTRTSFDSKALLRDAPEIHARYLKTATFTNLRVTASKGAIPCQSMPS